MRHTKRILTAIVLLALLVSTIGLTASAESSIAYGAATVTAAVLNIRSTASTSGSIKGTVASGAVVVVLEKTNSEWYKINYEGTVGYVSTEYLAYVVTAANFTAKGTINGASVRVRKGPGTSYDTVANCSFGESVDVIGINNGWYKVVTSASVTGYIRSDLMSVTGRTGTVVSTEQTVPVTNSDGTFTKTDAVVWGWGVRFRTGPGTTYDFTTSLNPGDKLTVIGIEDDWYKAIYNGTTGYITKQYVTLDTSSTITVTQDPAASDGMKGTVNASSVRFRTGAGTSSTVISLLSKGTSVTVLGTEGDWYNCSYNGKTGYISKSYVTVEGSSSNTSSAPASNTSTSTTTPSGGKGKVTCSSLNLRSNSNTSSSIITQLSKGTEVVIEGSSGGWLKVNVNGKTGWVSGEYISIDSSAETKIGYVKGSGVRFRSGAGTSYSIICTMPAGASICVYETANGWTKCSYNGKVGYISAEYISTTEVATAVNTNASLGEKIAQFACQFDGYSYVYGEETPAKGFDCSGLVYYVYHTYYGYSMHRTASTQYKYDGVYVSKDNLQPGDLIFFNGDGSGVTHVGIFVGSGKYGASTFIHASTSKTGVKFDDLNSAYYTRVYYGAKRIV